MRKSKESELCPVCGGSIPKRPPSHKLKYCSRRCAGLAKKKEINAKSCVVCGKKWFPKNRTQFHRNKTCSQECASKLSSLKRTGSGKPESEHVGKEAIECTVCGKTFYRNKKWVARSKEPTCSNECRYQLKSIRMAGDDNPAWKGGVTPDNRLARKQLDEWRTAVFRRDNYTCRVCGDSRGGNLNAHHIHRFSEHEDIRDDLNNGITLCAGCHYQVYGVEDSFASWFVNLIETGTDYSRTHIDFEKKRNSIWRKQEKLLRQLYWDEGRSTTEIGSELNLDPKTITYQMEKLNIPRRTRAEGLRQKYSSHIPEDFIRDYESDILLKDLAKKYNKSLGTLLRWRRILNLPRRKDKTN